MKIFYSTRNVVMLLVVMALLTGNMSAKKPVDVMILTGQNNHDWKTSSVLLKDYLDASGLFKAEIVVSPPGKEDMSGFKPDFASYDVIVLDYNGAEWPEETKSAFQHYVKNGGGVVIFHAADNAFGKWDEYTEMIGIGWGRAWPYTYWKDGNIITDNSEGPSGHHGSQNAFPVTVRDRNHPITKGLPEMWLHPRDELYDFMRGPATNMTVLATAFSSKESGGSGREEPALMTIRWGKGRIFHTILGHVWPGDKDYPGLSSQSFIITFLRGTEWAATGKVTQKVPADFTNNYSTGKPVVFNHSETVRPGEVVGLQGGRFGMDAKVQFATVTGTEKELKPQQQLTALTRSQMYIAVRIPDDAPVGLYAIWITNSAGQSEPVFINRARAMTAEYDEASPGGVCRLFGRNLWLEGAKAAVRLIHPGNGSSADARVVKGNPHEMTVVLPENVLPGVVYKMSVSNGYGSSLSEDSILACFTV